MKRDALSRIVTTLATFGVILVSPVGNAAETIDDIVRSATSLAERAEACSYAFSDLGGSIRAAHTAPNSMPIDLAYDDLQIAEDLEVSALVFDQISRQTDRPPARNDAMARIQQSMSDTTAQDDDKHTLMITSDKRAIQLCTPIYRELEQRGAVTRAQEDIFRKIVRDGTKLK
ncbi:hypothetical protein WL14_04840 [Burkholderia cepacia]|uniref:hypothetical protein n=1 Tax=Burkholderia cepacia TaxID=292 RepID=UPI000760A00D|nr:hypothetical protein [Burkholderia cepacia]KVZ28744.1 hypothetical protein WL14_04840 [Burkholderia cepacia]